MIGTHCGQRLVSVSDNPAYFRKRCPSCGSTFTQRKRKSTKPKARLESVTFRDPSTGQRRTEEMVVLPYNLRIPNFHMWSEYAMEVGGLGCKIYRHNRTGALLLAHNSAYGCKR